MMNKPNILFIFSDQQRHDTLGCYGQKLPVTPNLDALADKGVRFDNAYTVQPVCGPARACLQTGKYATEIGCFKNDIALPADEKTIADWLHLAGYETGYVGKWHLASQGPDQNYKTKPVPESLRGGYKNYWMASDVLEFTSDGYGGFLYNGDMEKVEFQGYRTDKVTDHAIDFIHSRDGEKPFFLFLSHIEPHHQNNHRRYEGPEGSKELFADYEAPGDLKGTQGDWRENYPDYLGCCHSLDDNVGRLMKALKEKGIDKNTLIIYTSDHGSHFRTRNEEYKRSCHDGSIHIPLLIHGPGFEGGMVMDKMVSLLDLPPTLMAAAGIEPPKTMQGQPLQNLVSGDNIDWPEEVFLQISESQVGRAIRTKKWKYAVRAHGKDGNEHSESDQYTDDFLYDLENDPYEKKNLADQIAFKTVRDELCETLKNRMAQAREKVPEILTLY